MTDETTEITQVTIPKGMYLREFFKRPQVSAGLIGALAMLVLLILQDSSTLFKVFLAAFTGYFIFQNIRTLAEFGRRRFFLHSLYQGDKRKWRKLESFVLPTQSFGKALRHAGKYNIFLMVLGSVGGAACIVSAKTLQELVVGIALFVATWLYAISDCYKRANDFLPLDKMRDLTREAFEEVVAKEAAAAQAPEREKVDELR